MFVCALLMLYCYCSHDLDWWTLLCKKKKKITCFLASALVFFVLQQQYFLNSHRRYKTDTKVTNIHINYYYICMQSLLGSAPAEWNDKKKRARENICGLHEVANHGKKNILQALLLFTTPQYQYRILPILAI